MAKASSAPVSRGAPQARSLGRYLVFGEIASGGTATVHIGWRRGPSSTGRLVAIKRLHSHLASDPQFTSMLLAEARLTERVRHPNVVPLVEVLDAGSGELLMVMDYVHGETLGSLLGIARRRGRAISPSICVAIMTDMLLGLHAAHEAESAEGSPLALVHGDVSPQNIIVGADGKARLLDFGIAKATSPVPVKAEAPAGRRMMGTPAYMAPERWRESSGDRRSDLFSAGVVFWEMLALDRLFRTEGDPQSPTRAVRTVPPPSKVNPAVPAALDAVVLRALQAKPEDRWSNALEFMKAAADACTPAGVDEVAAWLSGLCGQRLRERAADLARIEAVASAEYVATEIADEEPTVVENNLAARLALMMERDPPPGVMTSAAPVRLRLAPGMSEAPTRTEAPALPPDILDDSPTSCATLVRTPIRTVPLPLGAPLSVDALASSRPAPASAPPRVPAMVPRLDVVSPHPVGAPELTFAPMSSHRARSAAEEVGALPERYHRVGRRSYGEPGELAERPQSRSRGRLLIALASLPSAALALLLVDRARPAPTRAEAASPAIAVERPQPQPRPPAPTPMPLPAPMAIPAPIPAPTPATMAIPAPPPLPTEVPPPAATAAVTARPTAPRALPPLPEPVPSEPESLPAGALAPSADPSPDVARQATPPDEPPLAEPATERTPARTRPRPRPSSSPRPADQVAELHRRALQAYEDLDPDVALSLLQKALRRCQEGCGQQPRLLAATHLYLGVVLAGGFRQADLAARHLRIARTLQPSLAPPATLISPEVRAALRASDAGPARL
jgi:eukaryotic-like serine/threonine-protein kinase